MVSSVSHLTRRLLRRGLVSLAGSASAQRLLESSERVTAYLMGIGAGGDAQSSGERRVLELVRARGRAPYVIFDVGANQGQYAGLVLDVLGTAGLELHCFEPSGNSFERLQAALPADAAVTLNRVAVGREAGQATLYSDAAGSELASLTRRRLDHHGIAFDRTEQVSVITIDEYCSSRGIEHIDLLKIDVEGHEMNVLAGASGALGRGVIDAVAFEFGGCNIDTRTFLQDFYYLFNEAGMKLYRITPSGYLHPLTRYQEGAEQFRTTNYLALKGDAPGAGSA